MLIACVMHNYLLDNDFLYIKLCGWRTLDEMRQSLEDGGEFAGRLTQNGFPREISSGLGGEQL
jgi:hypothetical protein